MPQRNLVTQDLTAAGDLYAVGATERNCSGAPRWLRDAVAASTLNEPQVRTPRKPTPPVLVPPDETRATKSVRLDRHPDVGPVDRETGPSATQARWVTLVER